MVALVLLALFSGDGVAIPRVLSGPLGHQELQGPQAPCGRQGHWRLPRPQGPQSSEETRRCWRWYCQCYSIVAVFDIGGGAWACASALVLVLAKADQTARVHSKIDAKIKPKDFKMHTYIRGLGGGVACKTFQFLQRWAPGKPGRPFGLLGAPGGPRRAGTPGRVLTNLTSVWLKFQRTDFINLAQSGFAQSSVPVAFCHHQLS